MISLWRRLLATKRDRLNDNLVGEEQLRRQVNALFDVLSNLYGADKLVLKAGKLEALQLMRSRRLSERVLALQRLVFEDPTLEDLPGKEDMPGILDEVHEEMAERIARMQVEDQIEKRVQQKMQDRHEEYIRELKLQLVKEDGGPDNAQTLKKYAELEKLEQRRLSRSAMETVRPQSVAEVVGQERAIKALFSKIASPYPQHVILYGPPGVGKTTVARLALEYARTLAYTPFDDGAKFVEVDGTTLRWDPREVTNPLLGSVHDPIYQGAKRELADTGIPEPKPGLVTDAHGGVLFIDEIGELDPALQNKLLKVMEDKRVRFDSSYYDPDDPNVPKYIKRLFEDGAPADFILIGATTRDPSEINPALRSRSAEVFFEPLTQDEIETIVQEAAKKLNVVLESGVASMISDYTIEGRRATSILADAYGVALYRSSGSDDVRVTVDDVSEVVRVSRLTKFVTVRGRDTAEVAKILGLGVSRYIGSVLEIEAVAFKAKAAGKGNIRFNQTAGSMAKDSVFNAMSVVRKLTGESPADWDIHVNIVGGGNIDGPSAGTAIVMAIASAMWNAPMRQDVAVTGEISIQGKVKPVGGVFEKLYGAKQAGVRKVIIPKLNQEDIPKTIQGVEVVPVTSIEEVLPHLFVEEREKGAAPHPVVFTDRIRRSVGS